MKRLHLDFRKSMILNYKNGINISNNIAGVNFWDGNINSSMPTVEKDLIYWHGWLNRGYIVR